MRYTWTLWLKHSFVGAISDGQALGRSTSTQIVMEMIKLSGEAKLLRVDKTTTYVNDRTLKEVPSAASPPAHGG
eukprot:6201449-Pleurochrysis_carterae.AAC.1